MLPVPPRCSSRGPHGSSMTPASPSPRCRPHLLWDQILPAAGPGVGPHPAPAATTAAAWGPLGAAGAAAPQGRVLPPLVFALWAGAPAALALCPPGWPGWDSAATRSAPTSTLTRCCCLPHLPSHQVCQDTGCSICLSIHPPQGFAQLQRAARVTQGCRVPSPQGEGQLLQWGRSRWSRGWAWCHGTPQPGIVLVSGDESLAGPAARARARLGLPSLRWPGWCPDCLQAPRPVVLELSPCP